MIAPGCQSTQTVIDQRVPLREPAASDPASIPVTASDCRERWLALGPPALAPDLGVALERARTALPQTTALHDVHVRRETTISFVVDRSCLVVDARAVRAEDAEPLDESAATAGFSSEGLAEGVTGFFARLAQTARDTLR
jgi:hypothetical protein